jgi:hypothetical protein
MSQEPVPARTLVDQLRLHPRIAYQGHFTDDALREKLIAALPVMLPFRRSYHAALAIVDWDHHLPTRQLIVRLYMYYEAATFEEGESSFDDRLEEIGQRDRFPEFDVPDFSDLPADEVYEVEVTPEATVVSCRLTSSWRREVPPADGNAAVAVARTSPEFGKISASALDRPRHLGDLEAVSWTPPCESGHARWTLDVWYLLAFDGRIGTGRSLLVDLTEKRVITVRDFSVRAG